VRLLNTDTGDCRARKEKLERAEGGKLTLSVKLQGGTKRTPPKETKEVLPGCETTAERL